MDIDRFEAGPANVARVEKGTHQWTLVLVKDFRQPPEEVWAALTEPEQLRQWAPFDADRNLASIGPVKLTTVAGPVEHVTETTVTRAEAPHFLEFNWGGNDTRWELKATEAGTRLTLWTTIAQKYIGMGAAGWHLCLEVLRQNLDGHAVGRIVGQEALKSEEWHRLNEEYSKQFGIETFTW